MVTFDVLLAGATSYSGIKINAGAGTTPMSDFAFDVLGYTQNMESAGLTRQQAEAIATGMTSMIAHQFYSLLTTILFEAAMARIDNLLLAFENNQDAVDKLNDQIDRLLFNHDNKYLCIDSRLGQLDEV